MKKLPRPFYFVFAIPLLGCALLGATIFGGQALSETKEGFEIQRAIAKTMPLASASMVELANLEEVRVGYGICGTYRVADSDKGFKSFFYDTAKHQIVLDVNSRQFTSNCGLAAFC
ncbi:hypothetical protein [Marinobacter sp. JSM 1782161]|uniref:hypothetical protein n=1 Tax=Marinobacter sp. JSM 1782161 TaxID=2685906 RepID=UPI001401D263|nr:hypothetical protein [Marinobacter sp. JSM 1782161]